MSKKYTEDEKVRVFYSVLEKNLDKMNKVFSKFNLIWIEKDVISRAGAAIEVGGVLEGSYKDTFSFIKSTFGETTKAKFEKDYLIAKK